MTSKKKNSNRREFLKKGSTVAAAGVAGAVMAPKLSIARSAHAFGTDTIKLGLIGCGGRGTGASIQAMNTQSGNVELVGMADAFGDRLDNSLKTSTAEHKDLSLIHI